MLNLVDKIAEAADAIGQAVLSVMKGLSTHNATWANQMQVTGCGLPSGADCLCTRVMYAVTR